MAFAVFVSDDGRVLERIVEHVDLVVSDRPDLANKFDIEFHDLGHREEEILELFASQGVSRAVALGYRRLFSGSFIEQCEAELFNLHPSLLPAFKGLDVYSRVMESGVKYSGATLHEIVEEMDAGRIIDQAVYEVPEDVGVEELKARAAPVEAGLVRKNFL